MTPKPPKPPLAQFVFGYMKDNELNVRSLAPRMGMSVSECGRFLRRLVNHPEVTPTIKECFLLAKATGLSRQVIINEAAMVFNEPFIKSNKNWDEDLDRVELFSIFDSLPESFQLSILTVARSIQSLYIELKNRSE